MTRSVQRFLCGFSSFAALTAASSGALAQTDETAASQGGIDVITVTAQRRAESVQDVPIAVTALGEEALEAARIEDALDLQFNAPNIILSANRNLTIRGVGSQSFGGSNDAGVGILYNGVFLQGGGGSSEFYDLERIEVLRGPQGTLFGRNTTGGVINFITKRPDEEFGGFVNAQFESFSGIRVSSAINVPVTDFLQQRFAVNYLNRDGYTENLLNDTRIDGRNQLSVRSSTRLLPSPDTTVDLVVEFSTEDSNRGGAVKSLCTPDATFGCSPNSVSTAFPTTNFPIDSFLLPGVVRAGTFAPNPADLRQVVVDIDPRVNSETFLSTLEISHDFGPLSLTSITGFRRGASRTLRDFDQGFRPDAFNPGAFGTLVLPNDGFGNGILTFNLCGETVTTTDYLTCQTSNSRGRQVSTELHLTSDFEGPFNFIVGGYYLTANFRGNVTTFVPANRTLGFIASGDTPEATTESYAVFGEAYVDVTETIKLTGGVRYTVDDKTINTRSGTFVLGAPFIGDTSFDEVTWRGVAAWSPNLDFTDDTNLYFSVSRGFKSGGFNPGNIGQNTFDSEFVTAYELGLKNLMFDNRLQTNIAAFIYDYENLIVGNIVGTLATNVNIPSSKVKGIEVEVIAEPADGLRFEGSLGLLDTEIESDFLSSDPTRGGAFFQLMGNQLPNSPKRTLKLAAEYQREVMPGWTAKPRVDYYSQTSFFSREFNVGADVVDGWQQLDLQLQIAPTDRDISLTLFAKNVLNEDSITFLEANSNLVGSFRSAFLLDPRILGASLRVGF